MNSTSQILDFVDARHELTPDVQGAAVRLLGDVLTVGAAGAASDLGLAMAKAVADWGDGNAARTLDGQRMPALSAAWFNGFAIHCLEWDPVHEGAVVHALSVVTAALLAASDRQGGARDGEAFLTALAVGVDVACGLGIAATGPMRFFRPATAGVVGASLAVARLTGLPRGRLGDVLGLACAQAAGMMQAHVEGSTALPIQIANAARAAVTAVDLVASSLDGPQDGLEGPFGYHALIEPLDLTRYTRSLGQRWHLSDISIKPWPSGRASHGALGVLSELRRGGLTLDQVASVDLFAPPLIARLVGRPWQTPMPPAYARLCLALLVPLMLRDGMIDPRAFAVATDDPDVARLARHVRVLSDDSPNLNAMVPQRLVVTRTDGRVTERIISAVPGSPDHPLDSRQLAERSALIRSLSPGADPRLFFSPMDFVMDQQ